MKTVLIAGAGNFGCWWASSLAADSNITSITLYDPLVNNLNLALSRASNIVEGDNSSRIVYASDLGMLAEYYDLVVVATNSSERFSAFSALFSRLTASFWVLEKVLSYSLDELDSYIGFCPSATILVNHSRRMQPLWSKFKDIDSLPQPVTIAQRLGPWDLASNVFHFVDLISWLYSTSLQSVTISNSTWRRSHKRSPCYFDLGGIIEIVYECGIKHVIERDESFQENAFEFRSDYSSTPYAYVNEISGIASFEFGYSLHEPYQDWSSLAFQFSSGLWKNQLLLPKLNSVYSNTRIIVEALQKNWVLTSGMPISKFRIS